MSRAQWLLLLTCILSLYGVGQVWLVQLSSYRLWTFVGPREFSAYHLAWWHSIWGVVLAPAALVAVGALLMMWWPAPGVPRTWLWLGLALQVALILGTALWWGPQMARLASPHGLLSPRRYRALMTTHWLRVAIITAYGLLVVAMLVRSGWARP